MLEPIVVYSRCESAAYVRRGLEGAQAKGLLPTTHILSPERLGRRSADRISSIESTTTYQAAAVKAAAYIQTAKAYFEQARSTIETVKPVLYYYGALSFLEFVTSCLVVRTVRGGASHGLTVTCDSEGWDFDRNWPRQKCRVEMETSGDFPFFVDALTVGGFPSLLSGSRWHRGEATAMPAEARNPAPLLQKKVSLDFLCNLDLERYIGDHPELEEWLSGVDKWMVLRMTNLLLDFVVVYVASCLARYYIPAWQRIVEADKSTVFNDVKEAYRSVSEDLPYYFSDESPFQDSFDTRVGGILQPP